MRMPILACALLLLAGCAQPAAREPAAASDPPIELVAERPGTAFGAIETGPAAAPDLDATTQAAPELVRGEWWRIRFHSSFFDEAPEFVRVVASVEPDGYVVGMPHEGWFKEAIAYHAPAFGDVGRDLSYELHNVRFEPLRFPLVEGASWTTMFGTSEFVATVESADLWTATVRFDPPASDPDPTDAALALLSPIDTSAGMRLTYDARQHEVVTFGSLVGTWEVVEHGYGFEGWVTVPRGLHTAIDYGQFLPATPGEPIVTRTQAIEGGFNRLTLLHGIFALGPGAYRITDTAPNGTTFESEVVGNDAFTVRFYEASDPDGEWTLEDVVAGPGGTYTMGMAYHQYDIHLPEGTVRSDHSHPVIR
ncbi:MAG TPA: hypothetical protein VM370_07360 [Candidatus Thermoplasmatota archaeon]|nr:hypothetical protein [Candidatus Thermoplasmatota archaeon]